MITDAQVGYAFGEGMLDGLQLLFQVNNLTNEPYIAYLGETSRVLMDYQEYGTQYLVGAELPVLIGGRAEQELQRHVDARAPRALGVLGAFVLPRHPVVPSRQPAARISASTRRW